MPNRGNRENPLSHLRRGEIGGERREESSQGFISESLYLCQPFLGWHKLGCWAARARHQRNFLDPFLSECDSRRSDPGCRSSDQRSDRGGSRERILAFHPLWRLAGLRTRGTAPTGKQCRKSVPSAFCPHAGL